MRSVGTLHKEGWLVGSQVRNVKGKFQSCIVCGKKVKKKKKLEDLVSIGLSF